MSAEEKEEPEGGKTTGTNFVHEVLSLNQNCQDAEDVVFYGIPTMSQLRAEFDGYSPRIGSTNLG